MTLYRQYRPQTFAAIRGQQHVTKTLGNALRAGTLAHAYLFSGPRGVGKTSIARILAMAVNCQTDAAKVTQGSAAVGREPCGECQACQDIRAGRSLAVVEIDAASNRGIDEIRALRELVGVASGLSGTRVYIIDEVHMLTKEAFNALLKTLEEPPAKTLFILATTELHRVPETVVSRTQHFEFKRAAFADLKQELAHVAKQEGIELDPQAMELLTVHAGGAFRDALSLLGQVAATKTGMIGSDDVRLVLGIAPEAEVNELLTATFAHDPAGIDERLSFLAEHGYEPGAFMDSLLVALRHLLWYRLGIAGAPTETSAGFYQAHGQLQPAAIIQLIERLVTAKQQLRWSPLPLLPLELALVHDLPAGQSVEQPQSVPVAADREHKKAVKAPSVSEKPQEAVQPVVVIEKQEVSMKNQGAVNRVDQNREPKDPEPDTNTKNPMPIEVQSSHSQISTVEDASPLVAVDQQKVTNHQSPITNHDTVAVWKDVVTQVRAQNASLAALLKACQLQSLSEDEVVIQVPFSFYADRIGEKKNWALIARPFTAHLSSVGPARFEVTQSAAQKPAGPVPRSSADIERDVRDVFGVPAPATVEA